jgi:hypothetical protein
MSTKYQKEYLPIAFSGFMFYFYKYLNISFLFLFFCSYYSFGQNISYKSIELKGNVLSPSTFSIDKEGNLFILDSENNKLSKLNPDGQFTNDIGGWGWGNLNFDKPVSVDASDGLNIYVSDYFNHRVLRFNKQLEYISKLSTRNSDDSNSRFGLPTAIAVDQFSNLFLYDNENKRILKFDKNGNIDRKFGGYESSSTKITNPIKFEINLENQLFVLETDKLSKYDNWGTNTGIIKFDSTYELKNFCIDEKKIYIIHGNNVLTAFDYYGRHLGDYDLSTVFGKSNLENIIDIKTHLENMYILTRNEVIISAIINFE